MMLGGEENAIGIVMQHQASINLEIVHYNNTIET